MADTLKASWITDHAFQPRDLTQEADLLPLRKYGPKVTLPINYYLCAYCRLAEAAHRETTIERNP